MAIWKEPTPQKKFGSTTEPESSGDVLRPEPVRTEYSSRPEPSASVTPPSASPALAVATRDARESLIAPEIVIEGKIEGTGHVRIAGRFKGDVHVQGNVTVEKGAKLTGGVRAATVTVEGELEGNIDAATRVELLATGVLTGDLKAASLTVAAGSRMRGQVEFGWEDGAAPARSIRKADSSAA